MLVIAVLQAIWAVARGLDHGANIVSLIAAVAMTVCAALTIRDIRSPGRVEGRRFDRRRTATERHDGDHR
ncbi:hypothetical protein D9T14_06540 [Propionibacterium australiense]|nr:hypothetical protein D9T14_06540 [Propionibacterium australiense]